MTRPAFISLQLLNTCNLHCIQCDYYKEKAHPHHLAVADQRRIVREIAEWSPEIRLKITGGEPFLDKDRLFAVLEEAFQHNLVSFILTNGTLICDEDIERMLDLNLGCISVSLDSHFPAVHDRMRGVPGCSERVRTFLKAFTHRRQERGAKTQLWASTILTRNNLLDLDALVGCYENLGFDSIKFQPLLPNYRQKYDPAWQETSVLFPTEDEVLRGVDRLLTLKQNHPILDQSADHIEKMRKYFLADQIIPGICCGIMDHVMIVGCEGSVRFCFQQDPRVQMCEVPMYPPLDVSMGSLRKLWERAADIRSKMKLECHRSCGLLWDQVRDIRR